MKAFAGTGKNKHEVASVLAQQFSILMSKLPRRHKCWQTEDYRMSIFDAAAAGVAYFNRQARQTLQWREVSHSFLIRRVCSSRGNFSVPH